jgi:hypothetical protein
VTFSLYHAHKKKKDRTDFRRSYRHQGWLCVDPNWCARCEREGGEWVNGGERERLCVCARVCVCVCGFSLPPSSLPPPLFSVLVSLPALHSPSLHLPISFYLSFPLPLPVSRPLLLSLFLPLSPLLYSLSLSLFPSLSIPLPLALSLLVYLRRCTFLVNLFFYLRRRSCSEGSPCWSNWC